MREGWRAVRLREVLKLKYGKPLPKEDRSNDGKFPAYGANGVKCRTNRTYFDRPSIIVGRKGSAGEVVLTDGPFWPLDVTYFVTFDERQHDLKFLYHLLKHLELPKLADGVKPGINRNRVYDLAVAVPPLIEQKHIATILDQAFEGIDRAIANTEKNLTNARELFGSFLDATFEESGNDWTETTFGNLVSEGVLDKPIDGNHGETHPKKSEFVSSGIPFIMASDLVDGRVDQDNCNFLTKRRANALRKGFAKSGDVLLSHKGTIGRVAVLETSHDYVMLTPQVTYYRVLNAEQLNNRFLFYYFQSRGFQREIGSIAGIGTTRAYIGITAQQKLSVKFPGLAEQLSLLGKFETLARLTKQKENLQRAKLSQLLLLKQSILQKAFAGELTSSRVQTVEIQTASSSAERTALVLAFAYDQHERAHRQNTFGRVKAQKFLHLSESIAGLDLDRSPMKDAAGPNDFSHMLKAEKWAKRMNFFEFRERPSGGYSFTKLSRYDECIRNATADISTNYERLRGVVNLLLPMNSDQAEVFATVHAAWNNLIVDGADITDEAIIYEARENWHPDKLKIPVSSFNEAIQFIRSNGVVPDGSAKRVGGQEKLF